MQRLSRFYISTRISRAVRLVPVKGRYTEVLLSPFFVVTSRGVEFVKELRKFIVATVFTAQPVWIFSRVYFTCSPLPRAQSGQGLMKLAEKNANKMPWPSTLLHSSPSCSGVLRHHQPSKALVHSALEVDKNIRKRKLEAPPCSANLPGNLLRGSYTWLARVMTQDTFYEIFIRTRYTYWCFDFVFRK